MWGTYAKRKPPHVVSSCKVEGNDPFKVLLTHPNCAGARINDSSYGEPRSAGIRQNVRLVRDESPRGEICIISLPTYVHWEASRDIEAGEVLVRYIVIAHCVCQGLFW